MSNFKPVYRASDGAVVDYTDGYHTFSELYDHRIALWIALCKQMVDDDYYVVWRSKLHADGTGFPGWFILCLDPIETGKQISYHLPESAWDACDFPGISTYDKAPSYDGHTSADVLTRIREL